MPYTSPKQQRFAHAAKERGEDWAQSYTAHGDAAMREAKKHPKKGVDRFGNKVHKSQASWGNGGAHGSRMTEEFSKHLGDKAVEALRTFPKNRKVAAAAGGVGGLGLGVGVGHGAGRRTERRSRYPEKTAFPEPRGFYVSAKKNDVAKRRGFDPGEERAQRVGMYQAGLLGGGGIAAGYGARGAYRSTKATRAMAPLAQNRKDQAAYNALKGGVTAGKKHLALIGGGAVLAGGAGVLHHHETSRRARSWD